MLPFVQDRQAGAVMQDRACFLWGTLCKASVEPQCFAAASEEACADVALHFSVYYSSAGTYHYENGSGTCEVFGAQLTLTAVNLETGETISGEFESMPPSSFTVKGTPGVLYYTLAPHMHTTAGSAAFLEALLAWFPDVTAQITALG